MSQNGNQHIIELNGEKFVLGMRWHDIPLRYKNKDFIAMAESGNAPTQKLLGVALISESKATAVGGLATFESKLNPKEKVFSLAASLAKTAKDGIYVARLGEIVWIVAISDGVVVPGTDVVVHDDMLVSSQVDFFKSILPSFEVYTDNFQIHLSQEWELASSLTTKVPLVYLLRNNTNLILGLVGFLLALVLVFLAYHYLISHKEEVEVIPVGMTEEQRRLEYFSGIQSQLDGFIPNNKMWTRQAVIDIKNRYPVIRFGWTFEGVDCSPNECGILYSTNPEYPRFSEGFANSMGAKDAFLIGDNGSAMRIPMAMTPEFKVFDQAAIKSLPASSVIKKNWRNLIEMSSIRFPGIKFDLEPVEEPPLEVVGSKGGPLVIDGVPRVVKGKAVISGDYVRDLPIIFNLIESIDLSPVSMIVSYGMGKNKEAWKIDLAYVANTN